MRRFEYFDHTADTMFRAYGKDFQEALGHAVLAVYNVIVETDKVKPLVERSLTVSAPRRETLLYDLFEELLFLLDTEAFLAHEVTSCIVKEGTDGLVARVTIKGDIASGQYDVFGQIKAPTYNEMLIGEEAGIVFIQAVLDL